MADNWIGRAIVPIAVPVAFALFRKFAPTSKAKPFRKGRVAAGNGNLSSALINSVSFVIGAVIAVGGYYALLGVNRWFASFDRPALLHAYLPNVIWMFFPGFAALSIAWPLTMRLFHALGYPSDVRQMMRESSSKTGSDSYRVLVGIFLYLALPIGLFTAMALPERLTFTDTTIRLTHYASLRTDVFAYADATALYAVDGYLVRGDFHPSRDFLIEFSDGRRISANAVGDGGSQPSTETISLLLQKTGLTPKPIHLLDDLPNAKRR